MLRAAPSVKGEQITILIFGSSQYRECVMELGALPHHWVASSRSGSPLAVVFIRGFPKSLSGWVHNSKARGDHWMPEWDQVSVKMQGQSSQKSANVTGRNKLSVPGNLDALCLKHMSQWSTYSIQCMPWLTHVSALAFFLVWVFYKIPPGVRRSLDVMEGLEPD